MPNTYRIHNTVRRRETRALRRAAPRAQRMNVLLGGGLVRIVRGRSAVVGESTVRKLAAELIQEEAVGRVKVTTMDGRRVDVATLAPVEAPAVSPPLPHPPLDDASTDNAYPRGIPIPSQDGGLPAGEAVAPAVLSRDIPEGTVDEGAEGIVEDIPPQGDESDQTPAKGKKSRKNKKG